MSTSVAFNPSEISHHDLFLVYGAVKWVKDRITLSPATAEGGLWTERNAKTSWQGPAVGLRISMRGGPLDMSDDGSQLRTESLHAAERMLLTVVPANSVQGQFRCPDTDADFVAIFAGRADNLVGRPVRSIGDIAEIMGEVIFP